MSSHSSSSKTSFFAFTQKHQEIFEFVNPNSNSNLNSNRVDLGEINIIANPFTQIRDEEIFVAEEKRKSQFVTFFSNVIQKVAPKNLLKRRRNACDSSVSEESDESRYRKNNKQKSNININGNNRSKKRIKFSFTSIESISEPSINKQQQKQRIYMNASHHQSALLSQQSLTTSASLYSNYLSSMINLHINIYWSPKLKIKLSIFRHTSFHEFRNTVSSVLGYQIPNDSIILYHNTRLLELEKKLMFAELNFAFVDYLVAEGKLQRVAIEDSWRCVMGWWRDQEGNDNRITEVVRFAEETLPPLSLSFSQAHVIEAKPALESSKRPKLKPKSPTTIRLQI
ncbi:9702_t:CDS:2 [Ambispora leptoticha]|uniref:9702_t:CDS:1 n=1 Tax=Ambispora leptoticha TaxID=144679 RepID=A0A9N8VNE2_9GLOM|nr:9702_t:CDS:2 [Ambispora leptoticha]